MSSENREFSLGNFASGDIASFMQADSEGIYVSICFFVDTYKWVYISVVLGIIIYKRERITPVCPLTYFLGITQGVSGIFYSLV